VEPSVFEVVCLVTVAKRMDEMITWIHNHGIVVCWGWISHSGSLIHLSANAYSQAFVASLILNVVVQQVIIGCLL